jgi:hypothetical protein
MDNWEFEGNGKKGPFPVSSSAEFRFIRLTQTRTGMGGRDFLQLRAVEFFGTLFESLSCRVCAIESRLEMAALKLRIAMKEDKSLDGIMSYLTAKHGGNVHETGILTITSKSVVNCPDLFARNVADNTSASGFDSKDESNQWICWDFGERRVRPTHYTIDATYLKSWVVDGSLDGTSWTTLDRQTDNTDCRRHGAPTPVSFGVAQVECRFIRLTQTGKDRMGRNSLSLNAMEFFGTLCE